MTAIHAFFAFLYWLEHYPGSCTSSRQVSGDPSDPSHPAQYVIVYMGNCLQAALNVFSHVATYFDFVSP
jgi:hypothetical protein